MLSKLSSLDTLAFTSQAEKLSGQCSVTLFERAIAGHPSQDDDQLINWQLQGETDAAGHRLLHLHLDGAVRLVCQRCLETFLYPVQAENSFLVVDNESELAIGEDDPDAIERVLASSRFDGFELLEDELILSLPYVPRHEQCPNLPKALQDDGTQSAQEVAPKRKNPFKVLKQLKKDQD